jgi:hypothetical protein
MFSPDAPPFSTRRAILICRVRARSRVDGDILRDTLAELQTCADGERLAAFPSVSRASILARPVNSPVSSGNCDCSAFAYDAIANMAELTAYRAYSE